ncbi:MAG: TonB-dependent receptor, partial [Bryobacteraceae bacterium]
EFLGGYTRYYTNVNGLDMTLVTTQSHGIRNPKPDSISTQGFARINIAGGMQGIGVPVVYPLINADNLFNFVNTWNKQTGKHALKWGADIHRNRMDRFQPQGLNFGPRGMFNFNPGTTSIRGASLGQFGQFGNSWAAFLLAAPDQTSRTFMPITPTNRQTQVFAFFHDTFQVTPRLTLDLGVRWELYTPIKPRYAGGASNYDPETNSLLIAGVGANDLANNVKTDWNNFAPRIGFSYRLGEKSVVRGGYGISYYTGRFGFTGGTLSTQFPVLSTFRMVLKGTLRSTELRYAPTRTGYSAAPERNYYSRAQPGVLSRSAGEPDFLRSLL